MLTRRAAIAGAGALIALPAFAAALDGQLGWAAFDFASGRTLGSNLDRRFPMCSTFKWLLASYVLARVIRGEEQLERTIVATSADLLANSPLTRAAVMAGRGRAAMSVRALCAAITAQSDNAAANLLLAASGGPAALTKWLRLTGDATTRLDRFEPALNAVALGDDRDTTIPRAMLGNLRRLVFGPTLVPASRAQLLQWMLDCQTGAARLPAGMPPGWRIAHRTGTRSLDPGDAPGERAAAGDVGVFLPPRGRPILFVTYAVGWTRPLPEVEHWMASVARTTITRLRLHGGM